jgi:hypothetical protein
MGPAPAPRTTCALGSAAPLQLAAGRVRWPERREALSRGGISTMAFNAEKSTCGDARWGVAGGGDLWGAEARRAQGGTRSVLRHHAHCSCSSGACNASVASSAVRPGTEHWRGVGATRRPPQHEPPPATPHRAAQQLSSSAAQQLSSSAPQHLSRSEPHKPRHSMSNAAAKQIRVNSIRSRRNAEGQRPKPSSRPKCTFMD